MALEPYSVTVPRGQEHLLPSPMARRQPLSVSTGGGMGAETLAAIQRAKAYYAPGGGFGKGVEAGLERGRVKAMASGMQGLVSAGLAGTTMAGTLGKKYEEEVGAPTRLGVEERRAQAISGIEMAQAGMGFQAGQAGAQRSLQMYLADLQTSLQAQRRPAVSTAAPVPQARQFPSLYDQIRPGETAVPNWMGDSTSDWAPPREYEPSMAGKSLWAQQGSMWS